MYIILKAFLVLINLAILSFSKSFRFVLRVLNKVFMLPSLVIVRFVWLTVQSS